MVTLKEIAVNVFLQDIYNIAIALPTELHLRDEFLPFIIRKKLVFCNNYIFHRKEILDSVWFANYQFVPINVAVTVYFVVESPDLDSNQNLHRALNEFCC